MGTAPTPFLGVHKHPVVVISEFGSDKLEKLSRATHGRQGCKWFDKINYKLFDYFYVKLLAITNMMSGDVRITDRMPYRHKSHGNPMGIFLQKSTKPVKPAFYRGFIILLGEM